MYLLFFVSRLRVESRTKTPVIYLRYKAASDACEGVDFNEQLLNAFCFPLGPEAVQPKEVQAPEEYTFALTHNDGQRFTGFCRQIFPPAPRVGSRARYPQVLCIVAKHPWLTVPNIHGLSGVSPPRYMGGGSTGESLNWGNDRIELQVPPDCGNGKDNSGIPLARLLFHVPVEGMLTLVASLLLERRIVFVARSRDTVTAAVQAAQALIYPFRWHHIYLPILPRYLVDYLSAPMPFLVGLTQEMLPLIRHIPMSEVTTVDLDLQKLGAALEAVFKTVRSPTEYESSPLITGVMQEYFVRLFGSYRRYIHEQTPEPLTRGLLSSAAAPGQLTSRGGGCREIGRGYKESREGRGSGGHGHSGGSDSAPSPQAPVGTSRLHDDMLRGHGYYFDQPAFVAHRRSEAVRAFLNSMRHSQLYEMFVQERLAMAASGAIELTSGGSSSGHSFSCAGGSIGNRLRRSLMSKSNSANNLAVLDNSSQGGYLTGSIHVSDLTCLRESGGGGESTNGASSAGAPPCAADPFELRVERYPERKRLLREHLRSLIGEAAAAGGGGGGKLASKLRRHRRTDSEDLISQPHAQPFGPLHVGESIRRITTYPGLVDVSNPTPEDPFSYFAEWDLREDDDNASGSPSPSPRDREHKRSESGNSLHSVDFTEIAGANGNVPQPTGTGAFGQKADRGGRDRDSGRDATPLRRLSVPMLSTNAKSTYMSLRAAPSNESPGPGDRAAVQAAAAAARPVVLAAAGSSGSRLLNQTFPPNGGGGGNDAPVAGTMLKGGVQVVTLADGHRVYDGTFKDILRLAATEAKNNLLSGLSGLASPLASPRTKDPSAVGAAGGSEKGGAGIAGVRPEDSHQQQLRGGANSTGGAHNLSSFLAGSSFLSGLKEKVTGAGTKVKALGTLPPPGYKPQTTGEKAAKFKAQLTGGGGATLLAGADGKLKQPHAPQRPLGLTGGQSSFLGRSDGFEAGRAPGSGLSSHAQTPSFTTPMASPVTTGAASEAGAATVSPLAPLTYPRAMSVGGVQHLMPHLNAVEGAAAAGAVIGSGDSTPPTSGVLPGPGSAWYASPSCVAPPSDWNPFGTGSAPPAAVSGTLYSAASNWSVGGVNGSVASATTSPFAISAQTPAGGPVLAAPVAGCCATSAAAVTATGASSADATTADLLGLSPSSLSGVSSGLAVPAGSGVATFDPFAACDHVTQGRLESAGSNDFAAFASASSPREFPGLPALGPAPVVG
ncbi:hypothetical protein VOLCADRAFT_120590 [Volvox carteri f. nagariensis]|uniref:UDENN domain-containing protein n=1 Tax=Volvox carteri f. nagariensis TaxID=3068 RepID=D8TP94_VOLCA|nr:uncharacterized protein VOLCADRAFT_120590 [Volvox carteri f. nagariensis]EFJ50722.1 hypothetical protein VOLCADRAFT_120590 [Volvox carteri f. nagariensis]|eukprot:XP_002948315.1 hypothetical protein VOLCADRAFT_120590 [Volvox carteri f. nagariensis]